MLYIKKKLGMLIMSNFLSIIKIILLYNVHNTNQKSLDDDKSYSLILASTGLSKESVLPLTC